MLEERSKRRLLVGQESASRAGDMFSRFRFIHRVHSSFKEVFWARQFMSLWAKN